jgi:DNA-binding response OmpR family regulator
MTPAKLIMIIDDDPDDRDLFGEALSEVDDSFALISAKDGEHAMEIINAPTFEAPMFIFLDLNMPKMNGWVCLSQFQKIKKLKASRVIMYSTSQTEEDMKRALDSGASYFLTKPSRFSDLVAAISKVIHQPWAK